MTGPGTIPVLALGSVPDGAKSVPPIYREWARVRIQEYLRRPGASVRSLKQALKAGGPALGRWMLNRSGLPERPALTGATLGNVSLLRSDVADEAARAQVASVAKAYVQAGIMTPQEIQQIGPHASPTRMGMAIANALNRRIARANQRALARSPFQQAKWMAFAIEMTPNLTQGAGDLLCASVFLAGSEIWTSTPEFESEALLDAFRLATTDLSFASRYCLFAGPDVMFEAVFPWWWEESLDLMGGVQWNGDDPEFDQEAYRAHQLNWYGNEDHDPAEPYSAQSIEMARFIRAKDQRYPATAKRRRQVLAGLAKESGPDADLIRNIFHVAKLLGRRPVVEFGNIELESDTTHPTPFVLDPHFNNSDLLSYLMEGYGTEGVGAQISAPPDSALQFVRFLEDVVLEATLVTDALSAIAYHE